MPSPFPGMDPFLEHPEMFPDLHQRLISHLSEVLPLPEPYYARLGRRVWIEFSERLVEPDVNLMRPVSTSPHERKSGGVAVVAPSEKRGTLVRVPHDERREPLIEIYHGRGAEKRLVTSIEVLSPSNKRAGSRGRDLYLHKQQEILESSVHLVEIDLLRGGTHTTAVPLERALQVVGPFDYHVCVHYFDGFGDFSVYSIRVADRLPKVAVPLLPDDGEVEADLQALFNECYEKGRYRREINYQRDEVIPPLRPDQAAWAAEILKAAFPNGAA